MPFRFLPSYFSFEVSPNVFRKRFAEADCFTWRYVPSTCEVTNCAGIIDSIPLQLMLEIDGDEFPSPELLNEHKRSQIANATNSAANNHANSRGRGRGRGNAPPRGNLRICHSSISEAAILRVSLHEIFIELVTYRFLAAHCRASARRVPSRPGSRPTTARIPDAARQGKLPEGLSQPVSSQRSQWRRQLSQQSNRQRAASLAKPHPCQSPTSQECD
jgi:hypothetical protein